MTKIILAALVVALFVVPGFIAAGDTSEPTLEFAAIFSASGIPAGGTITLAAVFEVPDDHHITDRTYDLLYLSAKLPDGITGVDTTWPKGVIEDKEEVYRGTVAILYTLEAADDVAPGIYEIPYTYSYQLCRDLEPEICFLPRESDGLLKLEVLAGGVEPIPSVEPFFGSAEMSGGVAETVAASEEEGLEDRLGNALESGSLAAFVLVFIAGILISFTPCVYPMIPIIIGVVGAGAGGSKLKGFVLSLLFVLGLVTTYSILGVIAGATGALFGSFMSNPIVLWIIVVVFIALGSSMLGAFDITIPASLQGRMLAGEHKGVIGTILIGGVTGIVAAPCAGPPLLVLLSWIGSTGSLALGFLLMAAFAAGLGLLFIVIGTFAGAVTALPAAGAWMVVIKKGMGVVIYGVSLYYLSLLLPEPLFAIILGGFLVFVGLFLGAFARWENLGAAARFGKGLGILLIVAGLFYLLLGLAKENDLAPGGLFRSDHREAEVTLDSVPWRVNVHDEVVAQAAAENKPVLIDFYADWCVVCIELEHEVWNEPEVIEAANDYIPLKLDYTRLTPRLEKLRRRHGVGGLPTVVILGPDGVERSRFSAFKEAAEVAAWLKRYAGG